MGQIVIRNQVPVYCNLAAIQSGGSKANQVLANGEIWLVDTTNANKTNGTGVYDAYIKGNGSSAAKNLTVQYLTAQVDLSAYSTTVQMNAAIQDAISDKQDTISTVNVGVDANVGTPSATASFNNGALNINFSNLKGEQGVQGPQGIQGLKGDRGATGDTGITGDATDLTIKHVIDSTTSYQQTDIVGADALQYEMISTQDKISEASEYATHTFIDNVKDKAYLDITTDNGNVDKVQIKQESITDIIYEGKSYFDIFELNNWLLYYNNENNCGFDKGQRGLNAVYAGTPEIVSDVYDTPSYSLKCFGNTSTYLRNSRGGVADTLFLAARVNCVRYTSGKLGVFYGSVSRSASADSVTNGWETRTGIYTATSNFLYIGLYSSEPDLDGYVDSPVAVKMSIFTEAPTLEQMTKWYNKYIELKKNSLNVSVELATKQFVENELDSKIGEDAVNEKIGAVNNQLSLAIKKVVSDVTNVQDFVNSELSTGIINYDGSEMAGSNIRHTTAITNLEEGQIITLRSYYYNSSNDKVYKTSSEKINAVCALSEGTIVSSKGKSYNANVLEYTVPADIDSVILSFPNDNTYIHRTIVITTKDADITYYKQQQLDGNPLSWKGDLAVGDYIWLGCEQGWYHKTWVFTGNIYTFGTIKIGRGNATETDVSTPYVEITDTEVIVHSYTSSEYNVTYTHGLTITNNIQIIVENYNNDEVSTITIQSNGERWTAPSSNIRFGECINGVGLYSNGIFSDCCFSVCPKDLQKNIWIFGIVGLVFMNKDGFIKFAH